MNVITEAPRFVDVRATVVAHRATLQPYDRDAIYYWVYQWPDGPYGRVARDELARLLFPEPSGKP